MRTLMTRWAGKLTDEERWDAVEEHRARSHRRLGRSYVIPAKPAVVAAPPPGVLLGYDFVDGIGPVQLYYDSRSGHVYIVAKTRMGKSVLIEHIAVDDFLRGLGGLVLDPHGDLISSILWRLLLTIPVEELRERVVILDPADPQYAFALNLYEAPEDGSDAAFDRAVSKGPHVFERTWGEGGTKGQSWGPHLADLLGWCGQVLVPQSGTMLDCRDLLVNERRREELLQNVTDPLVLSFWRDEYPTHPRDQREFRSSTINKINAFLRSRLLRPILSEQHSTVRIGELMNQNKLVLVPLSVGRLGWEAATLLGTMFLAEILSAALARQDTEAADRKAFMLSIDEVHHFASRDLMEMYTGTGKYNINIVAAHQYRSQLSPDLLHAFLNATNHIYGGLIGPDGQELAWELDNQPPPGDLVPRMQLEPDIGGYRPVQYEDLRGRSVTLYDFEEGHRRTVPDMVAGTGSQLASQGPYHFIGKFREGKAFQQYRFESLPSPCTGPMPAEIRRGIDDLREHSRARYYRPRQRQAVSPPPSSNGHHVLASTRREEDIPITKPYRA